MIKLEGRPYDKPNIVTGANVQVIIIFCFTANVNSYELPFYSNVWKSIYAFCDLTCMWIDVIKEHETFELR